MFIAGDRWTCPVETCDEPVVVRPSHMTEDIWKRQLPRIQRKHSKRHAVATLAAVAALTLAGCAAGPADGMAPTTAPAQAQDAPPRPEALCEVAG